MSSKKKQLSRAYHAVLLEEITAEKWRKIVHQAVNQAIDGDNTARQWITSLLETEPAPRKLTDSSLDKILDELSGVNHMH